MAYRGLDRVGVASDEGLQSALTRLVARGEFVGTAEWEAIGAQVLLLAKRDARSWRRQASEYVSAYSGAAIEYLRRRPEATIGARHAWGKVVAKGRSAGERAVLDHAAGGLTGRDGVLHRLRVPDAPQLVSLEQLLEVTAV